MNPEEELLEKLRGANALIGYSPMGDEPDVHGFLIENQIFKPGRSIIADKNISPHDFALSLLRAHANEKVCVLVPGREFDTFGTRHGRGGGWYDRFLKELPQDWIRIGVLSPAQLSEEKLNREPWDEPVDYLLIIEKDDCNIITTNSRKN
ncbi:MAG: 5-formyltetrahydrofolate cyclo-ligase [Parcubacteria group bacterium Greene0714_7]|nr:MAG: 5-formyltetrahydrofolate cyclo-ligase [Parcubacteria group bacterium Greene0714_7]